MSARDDLTERGLRATHRLASLLRSLTAEEAARPVPGLDWTAADAAAHLVTLYGRALGDLRRSSTPEETAALNALCLAELGERDPVALAERLEGDGETVWNDVLPMLPDDLEVPFHAGTSSTIGPIMGVVLMELLVHGDDIARATDREWSVDDEDAWSALRAMATLLPAWRRSEVLADDTVVLVFGGEAMRITCTAARTDVLVVSADDVEPGDRVVGESAGPAMLGLFGRRPVEGPLADLVARFGPF